MTRAYALVRLLEHGPLSWRELLEITGWRARTVRGAIDSLALAGLVTTEPKDNHRHIYRLAA